MALARQALDDWVHGRRPLLPADLHPSLRRQSGVFVSLEDRATRRVVGCRGTLYPGKTRLADEIVANVREASLRDPLHAPLEPSRVATTRIVLCIPGPAVQVWPGDTWDARFFGLLVESGPRAAVMLPWEAPDSAAQQRWGRKRARIADGESAHLLRFPAVRFAESIPVPSPSPSLREDAPYW